MSADFLKIGDWNFICDRCGDKRKASTAMLTWDKLRVCPECFERRHPSDFIRGVPDRQSTPWNRPEGADTQAVDIEGNNSSFIAGVEYVGDADKGLAVATNANIQDWNTELTANRTVALGTTRAFSGDVFTIYRTGGGAFTLDVGGVQTIPANTSAVVVISFNGTAWVLESYTLLGI